VFSALSPALGGVLNIFFAFTTHCSVLRRSYTSLRRYSSELAISSRSCTERVFETPAVKNTLLYKRGNACNRTALQHTSRRFCKCFKAELPQRDAAPKGQTKHGGAMVLNVENVQTPLDGRVSRRGGVSPSRGVEKLLSYVAEN